MAITRYYDQLTELAREIEGEPDRNLLRAFQAAGLPTSTFYRARQGTDLQSETASKVAEVLRRWREMNGRTRNTVPEAAG